jgi:hypothetical protein
MRKGFKSFGREISVSVSCFSDFPPAITILPDAKIRHVGPFGLLYIAPGNSSGSKANLVSVDANLLRSILPTFKVATIF